MARMDFEVARQLVEAVGTISACISGKSWGGYVRVDVGLYITHAWDDE